MKIIFFDWQEFEHFVAKKFSISFPGNIVYQAGNFSLDTAIGAEIISLFTDSKINDEELKILAKNGLKKIILRSAGFDNTNVNLAKKLEIEVLRVASYSPESIAEFTITLILVLARKILRERKEHEKGRQGREIQEMGFLLKGKTLGLHGYGKIGREVAHVAREGFRMKVQFFDPYIKKPMIDKQVNSLDKLYGTSDIVSIHCPLNNETREVVGRSLLQNVKESFMLINTSRGEVLNSNDVKKLVKSGKIDFLGVDVWKTKDFFDKDLLKENVIQTEHVAFFTEEAVLSILEQTLENITGNARPENKL